MIADVRLRSTDHEETLKGMRSRCFRAILSIGAQPPVGGKGFPTDWPIGQIVRDARDAYGYAPERRRFRPTPKDLSDMMPVLAAIADHKHNAKHGERDYQIILARAHDTPMHRIRDILGTTAGERSLQRWLDRAVDEILNKRLPRLTEMSDIRQNTG